VAQLSTLGCITLFMSHEQLDTILKVAGSGLTGCGSLILAWRVFSIIRWVTRSLDAHDEALKQILRFLNKEQQTKPAVTGFPKHLMRFLDGTGFYLFIAGFLCLGVGMILNMIHFLL